MVSRIDLLNRQRVLAEFGDFVLANEDLDAVLTEGCRLVADALDTDLAKVLQIETERNMGLVRAGVGWREGIVGQERVALAERSSEAYAIKTSEPVITNDLATETRFHFPSFLREEGVVALVNVPIFMPRRKPWGVLQVDARSPRAFDQDDIEFLKTYAMILGPVIDRLLVVAEKEKAQEQVRARDVRLRGALDEMGEGFCVLAPDFTILEHNQHAAALSGDQGPNLIGRSLWGSYPGGERSEAASALKKAMSSRERMTLEHAYMPSMGSRRWLHLRAYPTDDSGLALIWRDVTERREAQNELEKSEESLRSAVEVGQIGLWDWNVATGEVRWSEEHYRLHGYAVEEVAPSYQAWLDRVHPGDRAMQDCAIRTCMETGDDYAADFRVSLPNGEEHWLRAKGRFFFDENGKPERMLGAAINITETRAMQDRQAVLVAELQHRTRNLLGVIRSLSERTARSSKRLDDFRPKFEERLGAMARVQGLLSRLSDDDDRVTFDELLETELAAISGGEIREKVSLEGPRGVRLRSSTVQTLALALHELATNALKYGAFRDENAHLTVRWRYEAEGEGYQPWLHIDWQERGVRMRTARARAPSKGAGRELIEAALPYQLRARTTFNLGEDGVHCTISIPVSDRTGAVGQAKI